MKTGINIGMPSTLGASDAAIQASLVSAPPADVTITINANDGRADGRLNTDGNYYTITFPDDYLGGVDLFSSARDGSGKIGTGVDASANLDIIFNIPVDMRIGANTANNIVPSADIDNFTDVLYSDPSIHLKLNTDEWDSSILSRLNITVNNYGVIIGAGGSGGWGGMVLSGSKTLAYNGWEGAGGGQGLHPAWDDPPDALGDYFDPADTSPLPAGQGGSGYGRWLAPPFRPTGNFAANGESGTTETGGANALGGRPDATVTGPLAIGGRGHWGGTVIYITSDVGSPTTGTHLNIYNNGWMSAGAGGGSGSRFGFDSGTGGDWGSGGTSAISDPAPGVGGQGNHGATLPGGRPGNLIWDNSTNLTVSNTIINSSANAIYGLDGTWPGP